MSTQPARSGVALITGAASGIGAASAKSLAEKGFTVVGADTNIAEGDRLFAELGAPHAFRELDVTDAKAWEALVAAIIAKHGSLDLVHLNAGVMSRPGGLPIMDDPLSWFTVEGFAKVSSVNLGGVVFGVIAALKSPTLKQIIITASGAAILPLEMDPFYTMTKFGALGLGLALEPTLKARGVRIDVICPGAIETGLTAPDIRAALKQEPSSFIGNAVATLATDAPAGPVWLAFSEAEGLQKYYVPGLPGMAGALDIVESASVA